MKMLQEFKKFAVRGNVVDMAVGIIVGGGFGKIATSLVNDVLMPPIGLLISGVDFADLKILLRPATETQPAVSLNYGAFINTVANFVIIAFAVFLVVKAINTIREREEKHAAPAPPPPPPRQEVLLEEIRDLLKTNTKGQD